MRGRSFAHDAPMNKRVAAWIQLWDRHEPPHTLALVRILVASVILWDFFTILRLGLVPVLFSPMEAGGFPDVADRNPVPELYRWFAWDTPTAWLGWGVMVGATSCLLVGFLTPLAGLVALLTSAQLALVLPNGDRGIDLLLRNALFLLLLSGCGRVWSVDALWRRPVAVVPSWPRHLLILQLAVVYFSAGVQKTAFSWTPIGGYSALYLILQDPSIALTRFDWLADWYPVTQVATAGTTFFEIGAGMIPFVYWFRATRTRPGWVRAWFNRVQPLRMWLAVGVLLHLGIAFTMALGIFPFAMLALYPAFFHPDEWRWVPRGGGVTGGAQE